MKDDRQEDISWRCYQKSDNKITVKISTLSSKIFRVEIKIPQWTGFVKT